MRCLTFLVFMLAAAAAAQAQEVFTLGNGIRVVAVHDPGRLLAGAVLVCPLPEGANAETYAGAAILRYLLWGGGEAGGRRISAEEYALTALRFGGSVDSTITPDALVFQYTLPRELLGEVFEYMRLQWSNPGIEGDRLNQARARAGQREEAILGADPFRSLLWELQARIWPDLSYASTGYAARQEMESMQAGALENAYRQLLVPATWTVVVVSDAGADRLRPMLSRTLGAIQASGVAAPEQRNAADEQPRFGALYELKSDVTAKYAAVAYRVGPGVGCDTAGLSLLAEYLRRCSAMKQLREELGGAEAQLAVGLDTREEAGILYIAASWLTDADRRDTAVRLRRMVQGLAEEPGTVDAPALESARKALRISYLAQRQSASAHALWLAGRAAMGLVEDDFAGRLDSADPVSIARTLAEENRVLTMVTVPK